MVASLASLDGEGWGDTEEKKFGEVPDGPYQVKIDEATVEHAKSSGRLQVAFQATIVGPLKEFVGRKLFWRDGIEDEENRAWFRGKLARIGVEWPSSATKLPDTLADEVVGTLVEVKVKNKDDFTNVYFNKALDSSDVDEPGNAPEEVAEPELANDDEGEGNEPEGIELSFDDSIFTAPQRKEITAQAGRLKFHPHDYASKCDLLADMGEYVGLTGRYDDPDHLIGELKKAKAPKS